MIRTAGHCTSFRRLPFLAFCRKSNQSSSCSSIIARTSEYPSRVDLAVPIRPVKNCRTLAGPSCVFAHIKSCGRSRIAEVPLVGLGGAISIFIKLRSPSPSCPNNPESTFDFQMSHMEFLRGGDSLRCSSRTSRCSQTGAGRFACPGC